MGEEVSDSPSRSRFPVKCRLLRRRIHNMCGLGGCFSY
jgi:hypothetical protein